MDVPPDLIPDRVAVMVLRDCNLLPGCRLPLYVFEPRYREMLAEALAGTRVFCVGTVRRNAPGSLETAIYVHSTAGLIESCVRHPDGTSHLVLRGLQRIELSEFSDERPFLTAAARPLDDEDDLTPEVCELLTGEIHRKCGRLVEKGAVREEALAVLDEGGTPSELADRVAFTFLADAHLRQGILGITAVGARLRAVLLLLDGIEKKADAGA